MMITFHVSVMANHILYNIRPLCRIIDVIYIMIYIYRTIIYLR